MMAKGGLRVHKKKLLLSMRAIENDQRTKVIYVAAKKGDLNLYFDLGYYRSAHDKEEFKDYGFE